jgi:hypothetical protein
MKHLILLLAALALVACSRVDEAENDDMDSGTDGEDGCGDPIPMAGNCDVTEELTPSDLELEEIPYNCFADYPPGAESICAEQPGVECFFDDLISESAYIFVFSSSEAVTALLGDECLEVPFDIDWDNERIVVAWLSDETCGWGSLTMDRLIFSYSNGALHLELHIWDQKNPWDENDTECASSSWVGVGLRVPTNSNPTVCLYKNPPCAE